MDLQKFGIFHGAQRKVASQIRHVGAINCAVIHGYLIAKLHGARARLPVRHSAAHARRDDHGAVVPHAFAVMARDVQFQQLGEFDFLHAHAHFRERVKVGGFGNQGNFLGVLAAALLGHIL